MKKKAPLKKQMKSHIEEERKDIKKDKKLLKEDMSMAKKIKKGHC